MGLEFSMGLPSVVFEPWFVWNILGGGEDASQAVSGEGSRGYQQGEDQPISLVKDERRKKRFLLQECFISTFQSRLMFNQAFSRGLEISLILAGKKEE